MILCYFWFALFPCAELFAILSLAEHIYNYEPFWWLEGVE